MRTGDIPPRAFPHLLGLTARMLLLRVRARLGLPRCLDRWPAARARDVPIALKRGTLWLAAASWDIDYQVFLEVFLLEIYRACYAGKAVIDLGAHRGYYGCYALLRGAAHVYSFEPSTANYASLVQTQRTFDPAATRWTVDQCAVSSHNGLVALHLSRESWSHSLYTPHTGGIVGTEHVPSRAFPALLQAIGADHPGRDIVVKINVEGAAGDIVLATPPPLWHGVSDVMLDYEPNTPCCRHDILRHLEAAGLRRVDGRDGRIVKLRRR